MEDTMTFNDACRRVFENCPDGYAKTYARAGINMIGEEARVQALYILGNMSYWRGDEAKQVRMFLKEFSKNG
jgi:hypothetical protein